jgi:hypothetical protein
MAGAARAVRIPREGDSPGSAPDGASGASSGAAPTSSGRRFPNTAGSARAYRTLLFFIVALAVIYGVFLDLAIVSVTSGTNYTVEAILTIAVILAAIVGWFVTLGQTPSEAWLENGQLVVRERTGRTRRFARDGLRMHVVRSSPGGLLGPDPTEFVELSVASGRRHTYLVGESFFDFAR